MFYKSLPDGSGQAQSAGKAEVFALVSLTTSESKRLIGKAVVKLPEVRRAFRKGLILIRRGTTCAYVAEELLGITIKNKSDFVSGSLTGGELTGSMATTKIMPFAIRDGKQIKLGDSDAVDAVQQLQPDDVLVKGANAVDPAGNAGGFLASERGIGSAIAMAYTCGFHTIVPVGLEKLIPSVMEASASTPGVFRPKFSTGMPVALTPFVNGKVVTEIQAFEILCGVNAVHIASGGIGGSEGSVVLSLRGSGEKVRAAIDLVKSIKGEPPVAGPSKVNPQTIDFDYSVDYFHSTIWPMILGSRKPVSH